MRCAATLSASSGPVDWTSRPFRGALIANVDPDRPAGPGARGGDRTRTHLTVQGVLSSSRLPVPPPGRASQPTWAATSSGSWASSNRVGGSGGSHRHERRVGRGGRLRRTDRRATAGLREPIDGRDVVTRDPPARWTDDGSGRYRSRRRRARGGVPGDGRRRHPLRRRRRAGHLPAGERHDVGARRRDALGRLRRRRRVGPRAPGRALRRPARSRLTRRTSAHELATSWRCGVGIAPRPTPVPASGPSADRMTPYGRVAHHVGELPAADRRRRHRHQGGRR